MPEMVAPKSILEPSGGVSGVTTVEDILRDDGLFICLLAFVDD
jgi:hypothetical protein